MAASDDLTLYILMRKDMESLDHTGKLIAQGAHAANHAAESISRNEFGPEVMMQFGLWQKQTPQGFGTTVVLGGCLQRSVRSAGVLEGITIGDINQIVGHCRSIGIAAAIITDPSYPLLDGKTLHAFPCDTCAWVFGSKQSLEPVLWQFRLHPPTAMWSTSI